MLSKYVPKILHFFLSFSNLRKFKLSYDLPIQQDTVSYNNFHTCVFDRSNSDIFTLCMYLSLENTYDVKKYIMRLDETMWYMKQHNMTKNIPG